MCLEGRPKTIWLSSQGCFQVSKSCRIKFVVPFWMPPRIFRAQKLPDINMINKKFETKLDTATLLEPTWVQFGAGDDPKTYFNWFWIVFGSMSEDFEAICGWSFNDFPFIFTCGFGQNSGSELLFHFLILSKHKPRNNKARQTHKPKTNDPKALAWQTKWSRMSMFGRPQLIQNQTLQ